MISEEHAGSANKRKPWTNVCFLMLTGQCLLLHQNRVLMQGTLPMFSVLFSYPFIYTELSTFISTTLFFGSVLISHLILLLWLCFSSLLTSLVILKSHLGFDYHLPPLQLAFFFSFLPLSGWPSMSFFPACSFNPFCWIFSHIHGQPSDPCCHSFFLSLSVFPSGLTWCTCSHNPSSSSPWGV